MAMEIPESSRIGETSRYRRSRNLNYSQNQHQPISETDPIPSIISSTRPKPTISSLLFPTNDNPSTAPHKKKNFSSATFRGLGCTASSQVSVPAVIRTSADWETKKVKKKNQKSKTNKGPNSEGAAVVLGGTTTSTMTSVINNNNTNNNNNNNPLSLSSSCVAVPDVWCGPGMGLTTDAASVDCVVTRRPVSGRGKVDAEKMSHRERPSYSVRRMVTPEDIPFLESDTTFVMPRSRLDAFGSRHHRHPRHGFQEGLAEIVMLQSNLLMGGRSGALDRYRDWRLDIDSMSYEELLELGDRIGYVSTGLREDEIIHCVRKTKTPATNNLPSGLLVEMERKCSICQEEYEADDEMGKLNCGHYFHMQCIKKWLSQKNACPICKTEAVSQS
ncbi:hypothetical protein ACH5RR_024936 [Cinchona calisaya]|uniref:RING-type E3 ubiquitin transferase n=1 Tax=Cinchona calisaya TaxID=153742 RepID=A0ABD2YY70_9GENT